ncbi:MAG: CapA family protein [Deltaproteobacteria bacterium]|jgi:poly-gamma-glutamate synthesis protein (capsule biosynthesis protein)|nr:CapA family protein [Deltaproteobacteria bacterium]
MRKTALTLIALAMAIASLALAGGLSAQTARGSPPMEDPSRFQVDDEVVVFEIPPRAPPEPAPRQGDPAAGAQVPASPPAEAAPAPAGGPAPAQGTKRATRVLFLGDLMCHGEQIRFARRKGPEGWDFAYQFARIAPYLRDSMVIANLETTFAGEGRRFQGYPTFNSPDSLAEAIAGMGVHVVTLANNHIFDQGNAGAQRTIKVMEENGIIWTGLGNADIAQNQPLLLEYDGIKFALLNFTYGSNSSLPREDNPESLRLNVISDEAVLEGLEMAAALSPDVTVALFHWGNEYQQRPTKGQERLAQLAADNGADLIIGTHPHVLQPVTFIPTERGRSLVAYSLGNFISNQRIKPRERGAILAVEFEKKPEGGATLLRASVAPIYTTRHCAKRECRIELLYAGPDAYKPKPGPIPETGGMPAGVGSGSPRGPAGREAQGPPRDPMSPAMPAGPDGAVVGASHSESAQGLGSVPGIVEYPLIVPPSGTGQDPGGAPVPGAQPQAPAPAEGGEGMPGLLKEQVTLATQAGESVIDFLGASLEPDDLGYYQLWDASAPDVLPTQRK